MKQIKLWYYSQMMAFHASMAGMYMRQGNRKKCRIAWVRWANKKHQMEKLIFGGAL